VLIARLIADEARVGSVMEAISADLRAAFHADAMPDARSNPVDAAGNVHEFAVQGSDVFALRHVLETHFPGCDMLVAKGQISVPGLFVSDMDSTMIGQECIDELADFAGLKEKIADITERAMQGDLDFEDALRERVRLLAGLDEGAIQQCLDQRIRPNPGARVLVETLKARGCRTALVTGGFHHFADAVADQIGFERVVGNRLEVANGKMTGGLVGDICDSSTKKRVHDEELSNLPQGTTSMAAGDGANDIPMLQSSTYGIAYCAKPKAKQAANGIVESGDLTAVLRLLGIPASEWVTD